MVPVARPRRGGALGSLRVVPVQDPVMGLSLVDPSFFVHGRLGSFLPVRTLPVLFCVCNVLGLLAPVHWWACSVRCVACAVSWANWLLLAAVLARCVVLRVRCPGQRGCCSPVCRLGVLCCVCGVPGHLTPVQPCACWLRCAECAVSWATRLLFTGVLARYALVCVWCLWPPGCCSSVCSHAALRCAPVTWATLLPFTGVNARRVVLCMWCPEPLGACSPVYMCGLLCCVCSVLGHLAPVHHRASVVLCERCPWPLGFCSPVCTFGVM